LDGADEAITAEFYTAQQRTPAKVQS